jgi:hypothetical protein
VARATTFAAPDGKPCSKRTVGLLRRRYVRIQDLRYIGKESNLLEEVEEGSIHDPEAVYTEYPDPGRDRSVEELRTWVRSVRNSELERHGVSRATIKRFRNGHTKLSEETRKKLEECRARMHGPVTREIDSGAERLL